MNATGGLTMLDRMRSLIFVVALILPVAMTGACAGNADPGTAGPSAEAGFEIEAPVGSWKLVADAGDVTFVVAEDGAINGTAPCNGYFGKWTLGLEQSTLGPFGATRKMCAPDVMDREQAFFAALEKTAGWRRTDSGIVLVDTEGSVLLSFVAAD